jgi:hypothetical protein
MSSRVLTLTNDGSLVVIRGYKAAEAARGAGLRPTYSGSAGGWMLDASRLPELVAHLEYRNRRYTLAEEQQAPPQPVATTADPDDGLVLW